MKRNTLLMLTALAAGWAVETTQASTPVGTEGADTAQCLYPSVDKAGRPHRIPAIATAKNGHIFAISDYRPCGNDIGYGEVDIKCRISTDHGKTWTPEFTFADGVGDNHGGEVWRTGFGDAAVVADAKRNEVLVMMVCGKTVCWHGNYIPGSKESNPNRVARVRVTYNKKTKQWDWTQPVEVTEQIYSQFVDEQGQPTVQSLFIGSGRICQSRQVKVGKYYRLYCAVWTKNQGNRVMYSDDFGENWYVLGTLAERPAPQGDEPKCEELPDGSVLLSSRKGYGRFFNIFKYTDVKKAEGKWGEVAASHDQEGGIRVGANSTNGEVMLVQARRNADGKKVPLLLQSLPAANNRAEVTIFYKPLETAANYDTPQHVAEKWEGSFRVTEKGSAYSTFCLQKDKKIGFFYEEEPGWYNIMYVPLSLERITEGKYSVR